ncbi:MAG: alpha/beta hydrolase [Acidimicrobiia bacterium]|nr:alpha/beta hydrolase [Acidimicrobiia bacterium]
MLVTVDDGVALEVVVTGSGPALFLVHGFGGAKEDFSDHIEDLSREYRVVVFDHRGHGESGAPTDEASYSLERLGADILCVADALGVDTFVLLGHSMGGMVARKVALTNPDRIDALILMDTCHGPIAAVDGDLIEMGAQIALTDGMTTLKEILDAGTPLDNPAYQRLLEERPGYREFQEKKFGSLSAVMWATIVRAIRDQSDDLEAMRSLEMPTLVMVGEVDLPFVSQSRAMADAIPGAVLAVIPDAGHSPQFENADAWAVAVKSFLLASSVS